MALHAGFLEKHPEWDGKKTAVIVCSFIPGSVRVSGYTVTKEGYEWGRQCKDGGASETGFDENTMFTGCPVLFSDKYVGCFLVPSENGWNYNFRGIQFRASDSYDVMPDVPKEYYDPVGGSVGRVRRRSIGRSTSRASARWRMRRAWTMCRRGMMRLIGVFVL